MTLQLLHLTLPWIQVLLLVTRWCEGTLQCLCTTAECEQNNDIVCHTDSLCYVQYTPSGQLLEDEGPQVVRGCIDGKTPLLCENQRPGIYSGSWPVLYCCRTDFCNKDAMPTLPAWVADVEDPQSTTTAARSTSIENIKSKDRLHTIPAKTKSSPNSSSSGGSVWDYSSYSINPLYIGVPVAGACVLLAIIIFAIYILRKQSRMYREHYQRCQVVKRRPPCQDGCRFVTIVTAQGQPITRCQNGCHYAPSQYSDIDRSSNGSESRLLAHV